MICVKWRDEDTLEHLGVWADAVIVPQNQDMVRLFVMYENTEYLLQSHTNSCLKQLEYLQQL